VRLKQIKFWIINRRSWLQSENSNTTAIYYKFRTIRWMINSEGFLTKVKGKFGLFKIESKLFVVKMSIETLKGT
jgi:hypothetical protein